MFLVFLVQLFPLATVQSYQNLKPGAAAPLSGKCPTGLYWKAVARPWRRVMQIHGMFSTCKSSKNPPFHSIYESHTMIVHLQPSHHSQKYWHLLYDCHDLTLTNLRKEKKTRSTRFTKYNFTLLNKLDKYRLLWMVSICFLLQIGGS